MQTVIIMKGHVHCASVRVLFFFHFSDHSEVSMAEVGKDYTGIWFHMLTSVPWICWKEKCRSHVTVAFRRVSWGFVSVTSEHDKIATFVDISQACCLK